MLPLAFLFSLCGVRLEYAVYSGICLCMGLGRIQPCYLPK